MKRIYVNEEWCLGCRLCEYYCSFAGTGEKDMARALKEKEINPNIKVHSHQNLSFAVSCRHCEESLCQKSCITGALQEKNGVKVIDLDRCVGCYTCILVCPVGAIKVGADKVVQKCELCLENTEAYPACVKGCPNAAIVYEERDCLP